MPSEVAYITSLFLCVSLYLTQRAPEEALKKVVVFVLLLCAAIVASRTIGIDTIEYQKMYYNPFDIPSSFSTHVQTVEFGYFYTSLLFFKLGFSYSDFSFITSAFFLFSYYFNFNRKFSYQWLATLLVVTSVAYYQLNFNQARQGIAVAIVFFAFRFSFERKLTKFIASIAIAFTFHVTAIFLLFIYPFHNFKLTFARVFFILMLSLGVYWFGIAHYLTDYLSLFLSGESAHKLNFYLISSYADSSTFNFSFFLTYLGFTLSYFVYYHSKKSLFIDYIVRMILLGFFVEALFFDFFIVSQRLSYYFLVLHPILYASLFQSIKHNLFFRVIFAIILFLFLLKVYFISVGWYLV